MMPPTENEIAYTAGLIDGEGSIFWQRRYNKNGTVRSYPVVSITNTDRRPLDWVRARWGGKVYAHNSDLRDGRKLAFHWTLFGSKAEVFLVAVRPYLIIKAERCDSVTGTA